MTMRGKREASEIAQNASDSLWTLASNLIDQIEQMTFEKDQTGEGLKLRNFMAKILSQSDVQVTQIRVFNPSMSYLPEKIH